MSVSQLVRQSCLFPAWGEDRRSSGEKVGWTWEGRRTPLPPPKKNTAQEIHGILWVKLGSTGEAPQDKTDENNSGKKKGWPAKEMECVFKLVI